MPFGLKLNRTLYSSGRAVVHFRLGWVRGGKKRSECKTARNQKPENLTKEWKAETHGFFFLLRLHSAVNVSIQWRTCDIFCSCETDCPERGELGKLK